MLWNGNCDFQKESSKKEEKIREVGGDKPKEKWNLNKLMACREIRVHKF